MFDWVMYGPPKVLSKSSILLQRITFIVKFYFSWYCLLKIKLEIFMFDINLRKPEEDDCELVKSQIKIQEKPSRGNQDETIG